EDQGSPASTYGHPEMHPGAGVPAEWASSDPQAIGAGYRQAKVSVQKAVALRHLFLASKGAGRWDPLSEKGVGRLLLVSPDISTHDGCSARVSAGFISEDDIPPHGTWITYILDQSRMASFDLGREPSGAIDRLIALVPRSQVERVGQAISVNASRCLS